MSGVSSRDIGHGGRGANLRENKMSSVWEMLNFRYLSLFSGRFPPHRRKFRASGISHGRNWQQTMLLIRA